ncbi:hypothetical protein [Streptomyces sp. ICC1]|uniref:hypothetical protein n=1 Tax=Streptomyces sp. ICC1 TaxID=2099583 RepID=UPI000DC771C0|nr:hypothetical protein [Streptomyces sp. ICC1]AWZ12820.1 hypothetical protein DRB96_11315 [Streptomyces sp. ICC1]
MLGEGDVDVEAPGLGSSGSQISHGRQEGLPPFDGDGEAGDPEQSAAAGGQVVQAGLGFVVGSVEEA